MKRRSYERKPNSRDRVLLKGEVLTQFLNRWTDGIGKRKILSLIQEYANLQRLLPKIVARGSSVRVVSGPRSANGAFLYPLSAKEAARSVKKINRFLGGYHFRRSIDRWAHVRPGEAPSIDTYTHPSRDSARIQINEEYDAVDCVIALATVGELARLKQCPCGRWFMAGRTDKTHCSDPCKAKRWRKTRQNKKAWATYMREYRLSAGKAGR